MTALFPPCNMEKEETPGPWGLELPCGGLFYIPPPSHPDSRTVILSLPNAMIL